MKKHVNKCDQCNQRFRKVELFNEHRLHCVGFNSDVQFRPSFTTVNDHSLNTIEEQLTLMTIQPNHQNVPSNDQVVPSDDLMLDSSAAINSYEISDQHEHESIQSVPSLDESGSSSQSSDRTSYWKSQKQIKRKSRTLEDVIQSLSAAHSPLKNQLIQNVVQNHPKSIDPLLKQNENDSKFENLVSDALLKHLKCLNKEKRFPKFHECLNNIFGDQLTNDDLLEWLSTKLEIRPSKFKKYVAKWRENKFQETRGRQEQLEIKQKVYDIWLKNAINSTDGRNGRNMVRMSKRKYIAQYGSLKNENVVIEEIRNKRGQLYYSANRMVATCTVRSILQQASQQGISVSYGTAISVRPFFVTFATEKEIALCLCKVCLNCRMLLEPLMAQAKRDNDNVTESVSEFLMYSCKCSKSPNGYFQWNCVSMKCKECKKSKPMPLECQDSEKETKVYQFEVTKKPYKKINKKGEVVEKVSDKTERVEHSLSFKELYQKLVAYKKIYTSHKYQVYNNQFHWPKILSTCDQIGEIYHMDFSENLSQQYKYEPQSCHFNKQQY